MSRGSATHFVPRNPHWGFGTPSTSFSKDAGCGDTTISVAHCLRCLMTLPADVIYSNTSVVTETGNFVTFVPTVDGDLFPDSATNLLQDQDYLTSIGYYDYDFLVGTVNNEGVVIYGGLAL
ncbi:hypothetical protein ACOMHN_030441 [Nucella lapillus]